MNSEGSLELTRVEEQPDGLFRRLLARLKKISLMFVLMVLVPALAALAYFGFLTDDVYISQSSFVVRSPAKASISPLGAVLGGNLEGASEEGDAVAEFLQSRRALAEANGDGLVKQAYSAPEIFWADRFGGIFGTSDEELYAYFLDKVSVQEGASAQVTRLSVRAYDPVQAQQINTRLLERSEALVNGLSERARADSIAIAQDEVEQANLLTRDAALKLASFRDKSGILDPKEQAVARLQMISKLQDELIASRTRLRQLEAYTPKASQIPFLRTQITALQSEIDEQMDEIAGGAGSLSSVTAQYQELQLNSQFAEKQLAAALASLQEAQAEARRKQAYVERISSPSLPDYANEPRRIRSILATLIFGFLAWGVLSMLMVGIKEHRD